MWKKVHDFCEDGIVDRFSFEDMVFGVNVLNMKTTWLRIRLIHFFIVIVCISTISCLYDPGDSISYQEKGPLEPFSPLEVTLNDYEPLDTIDIVTNTSFTVRVNTYGKKFQNMKVAVDQHHSILPYDENNPYLFQLLPSNYTSGVHKLTIQIQTNSGTRSLADAMGFEGYTGEVSWYFRVINYEDIEQHFTISHRWNKEGFFEVYWDYPDYFSHAIERCLVKINGKEILLNNPLQKDIVDTDFLQGYVFCEVRLYYKGNRVLLLEYKKEIQQNINFYFENIGIDSFRVSWDRINHPNINYNLSGSSFYGEGISDTTVIVPQPPFDRNADYTLKVYQITNPENYFYAYGNHKIGTEIPFPVLGYVGNYIYTMHEKQLLFYDFKTLEEVKQYTYPQPYYHSSPPLLFSPDLRKVVEGSSQYYLTVFDNNNLDFTQPVLIDNQHAYVLLHWVGNNRLLLTEAYDKNSMLYDAITGEYLYSFTLAGYNENRVSYMSVSVDGKYLCYATWNGMMIFHLGESEASKIYSDNKNYTGIKFHPTDPELLIVNEYGSTSILKIPEMTIIKTYDSEITVSGVDVKTGLLLCRNYEKLMLVTSIDKIDQPVFEMRALSADYIYDWRIFSSVRHYFDVTL